MNEKPKNTVSTKAGVDVELVLVDTSEQSFYNLNKIVDWMNEVDLTIEAKIIREDGMDVIYVVNSTCPDLYQKVVIDSPVVLCRMYGENFPSIPISMYDIREAEETFNVKVERGA